MALNSKILFYPVLILALVGLGLLFVIKTYQLPVPQQQTAELNAIVVKDPAPSPTSTLPAPSIAFPINSALERVTKKPFGIYITPKTSPVQPERFSGYHTGVDFETFADEQDADVPIYAICSGPLLMKKWATGYGGVAVQKCQIAKQEVTVIYGHIKLTSIQTKIGQMLTKGQKLGVLGKGYSTETNGERKHLHLGIHKSSTINILGYVQTKSALDQWIDVRSLLSPK
jgi:murein DD-endopeptidase MepM/ murein hydrolase activator NlpD